MNSLKKVLPAIVWALPALVFAQSGIEGAIDNITSIIGSIVPLLIGAALVVFLWGVLMYVIKDDSDSKGKAVNYMVFGIIGLFVMVSVWGLVNLLQDTLLDGDSGSAPDVPEVPGA